MNVWVVVLIVGILALAGLITAIILLKKKENSPSIPTSYVWATSTPGPDECSVPCGGGKAHRVVSCVAKSGDSILGPAPDERCDPASKPADVIDCNTQPCEWVVGDWSACSKVCGGGTRNRSVSCPDPKGDCEGAKPDSLEECNTQSCDWVVGDWSDCKVGDSIVKCGKDAKKTRTVSCPGGADSSCPSTKPDTEEGCPELPFCDWKTTDWQPDCKSGYVCGKGEQTRNTTCIRDSSVVGNENCDPEKQPSRSQECDTGLTCAWNSTKWYPYPPPSGNIYDGIPASKVNFLVRNNQNTGLIIGGNGLVYEGTSPQPIDTKFGKGVAYPAGFGVEAVTDGMPVVANLGYNQINISYDKNMGDLQALCLTSMGAFPITFYPDPDGLVKIKVGASPSRYFPKLN